MPRRWWVFRRDGYRRDAQSVNSTAAINGLNAANGVTGINASRMLRESSLNGNPPQGSNAGVTGVTINGVTQASERYRAATWYGWYGC